MLFLREQITAACAAADLCGEQGASSESSLRPSSFVAKLWIRREE